MKFNEFLKLQNNMVGVKEENIGKPIIISAELLALIIKEQSKSSKPVN